MSKARMSEVAVGKTRGRVEMAAEVEARKRGQVEMKERNKVETKKRDHTIDLFRGLAALWIIVIHTCFHSGFFYVDDWVRSFSLIIDVPLFIFISGMAYNFSNSLFKTLKRLLNVWYKWLIFLILFFVVAVFVYRTDLLASDTVMRAMFFDVRGDGNMVPIVSSSMWFIFMYFAVVLICNTLIYFYRKERKTIGDFKYVVLILFLLFGMSLCDENLLVIPPLVLMYAFIYCLGYYLYNFKFRSLTMFLAVLVGLILGVAALCGFGEFGFLEMSSAKFAPHLSYLAYSMISITVVMYLKDKVKVSERNVFCFLGRNALLLYFCQGIGASLIYFLYPLVAGWPGAFFVMLAANLVLTFLCFAAIYGLVSALEKVKIPGVGIFAKK